jgi:dienelactone hydrolase
MRKLFSKIIGLFAGLVLITGCQTMGLNFPKNAKGPVPAVVLVGGTGGSAGRYEFHGPALQEAGFAVYLTDYWPINDRSLSAHRYVKHAFQTLQEIQKNPAIDPKRIAIVGFSRGGKLSLLTAEEQNRDEYMVNGTGFAAHVAFYPSCGGSELAGSETGAPVFVLTGEEDLLYGGMEKLFCPMFIETLNKGRSKFAELKMYPGAGHGFDSDFGWDGSAAVDSRRRVVEFLKRVLKP